MFKDELKNELKQNYESINNISKEIINIKVAIHNLEKLGILIQMNFMINLMKCA